MKRRTLATLVGMTALVGALVAIWAFGMRRPLPPLSPIAKTRSSAAVHPEPRRSQRAGKLDLTFLVFSDTHLGYDSGERDLLGNRHDSVATPRGVEKINAEAIADMNQIAGKAWPRELSGIIGVPRGLLISGDLTENGFAWEWHDFVRYYGLNGRDGLVRYPVFEGHGNHDKQHDWYVLDRVRERHGDTHYAFDWDDLHLVCLGEAPDTRALDWLARDLKSVGRERPILLYFHFPLRGPYSVDNWFGRGNFRETLRRTLTGYNVVALFHGHYHASGRYRWHDWDVYNVGAAKHRRHSFAVVHATDERLRVASWHFTEDRWEWWHQKAINGARSAAVEGGRHAYSDGVVDR